MLDLVNRMMGNTAIRPVRLVLLLAAVLLTIGSVAGALAQPALEEPEAPTESPVVEPASESEAPPTEVEVTEVDRILRIERVLELDGQRLSELREDLKEKDELLDTLASALKELEYELGERRSKLEELDPSGDSAERESLEERIGRLETDVDLYKTQADLEYGNSQTYREGIAALEKKLEREQRALDQLTGKVVVKPGGPPAGPAVIPVEEGAAPSGVTFVPGMPPMGTPPTAVPPSGGVTPETADQIAARRAVERKQRAVEEAEDALVEFVKRKESLGLQIELERKLIRTAEGSRANMERALAVYKGDLEARRTAEASESELRELEDSVTNLEEFYQSSILEIEERTVYVASLEERLDSLAAEEETLTRAVAVAREEEEAAVRASLWLQSPLHPVNLIRWLRERGPRMLMVLIAVIVLLVLLRLSVRRIARLAVRRGRGRRSSKAVNRADTLAFSFKSAATMLIVIGGVLLILQEAGVDIKTVLGGAAIFGVAIAFGAQNLMRDYFTGFLILLEDQFELGDLVTIDGVTGRVEKVNMRTTVLRDIEGRMHFIPNGNVRSVTNRSYEWGRAVLDIPVGFQENVDRVMRILLEVGEEMRLDPEFEGWITDEPVMLGVDKFTESGIVIKFMAQTRPDKIFPTRRELLRRVKNKFDEEGIVISVPHRILVEQHKGS